VAPIDLVPQANVLTQKLHILVPADQNKTTKTKESVNPNQISWLFPFHMSGWQHGSILPKFDRDHGSSDRILQDFFKALRAEFHKDFEGDLSFAKLNVFKVYEMALATLETINKAEGERKLQEAHPGRYGSHTNLVYCSLP
jgi:hypothetical protein